MKNLFDPAVAEAIRNRIAHVRPDDQPRWGRMNAAQALAHSTGALELALGERRPPRLLAAGGPRACTTHPHPFFGPLTPNEWAVQQYKHLDHHLRQFGR